MQSTLERIHAAIIMDGNGRWAMARGLPRLAGHRAGADAVRRTVEAAPGLDIGTLTLFAFSSDNWRRPPGEVCGLMDLFASYLVSELPRCLENGVRITFLGRRDRLGHALAAAMSHAEGATRAGKTLDLRVAVDYSARDSIAQAAGSGALTRDAIAERLGPEVDLLIRTGGEQRLSDFLLWECAYAELVFSRRMWPDFDEHDLAAAVREFRARERRFGAAPVLRTNGHQPRDGAWLD
jgi:undecaprenyl diphosphate synthase